MNHKGQSALEYLMTYGWALIVIAIVVGVLVFIVSSPAGDVVCSSDQPNKILVKASDVTADPGAGVTNFGTIILTNITGGNMSNVTCDSTAPTGAFSSNTDTSMECPSSVTSGTEFTLEPDELAEGTSRTHATSTITISYDDYAGLAREAVITCSGPITTN